MSSEVASQVPLLAYALHLQREYEANTPLVKRKEKGQFFTPPEICRFMASLFSPNVSRTFRLLDPGAGIGALSAAVCDRLATLRSPRRIELHLFESDPAVVPLLHRTMKRCVTLLDANSHSLSYEIHEKDFILDAAATVFGELSLFGNDSDYGKFDGVIMNPPYFKVNKASEYARVMNDIVHGQPNIYAFFLAAAAQMLRPAGELVAITPRSFCNGLYFRGFRQWFFERMALDRIHLFESRTDTFRDVLQESVITLSHRLGRPSSNVTITTSRGVDLQALARSKTLSTSSVIDDTCGHAVVRIPASEEDLTIAEIVESWPDRFSELGLRVSTGPVVTFRAKQFLLSEDNGKLAAPLLSVLNVKPFKTEWPVSHKKHPTAFRVCPNSMRHLLPVQNYVLLRRFSAKEERRRLTASCLLASDVNCQFIALENHLNYVYHAERELTIDETFGLAAIFNSALLDRYFRTLSGNTQVNATELRTMKFPTLQLLGKIGSRVKRLATFDMDAVEAIVLRELGIDGQIRSHLLKGTLFSQI